MVISLQDSQAGRAPGRSEASGTNEKHETSAVFRAIKEIHAHDSDEDRLIHHWTGTAPSKEDWEMESGIGDLVAACVPRFFFENAIEVHAIEGMHGRSPKFRSVRGPHGSIRVPRDVCYFLEDKESGERLVLVVETDMRGGIEISFYSTGSSSWIERLRDFAKADNHLRGRPFDLQGSLLEHDGMNLSDVVLTEDQAKAFDRHIVGFANRFDELVERGSRAQRGVLLEGVPGCGKSVLLRAIAHELNGVSVCLAGPDQICQHDSVEVLRQLIEMTAPCVVIIEEIDIFGADRRRMVNPGMAELMQVMDGLRSVPGVLWVGTTNRPEVVETALADRPGRFDRRVEFGPLPDAERGRLIDIMVRPQSLTDDARRQAVELTRDMTGAQVRELIETMRIIASVSEFETSHVREAWEDAGFEGERPFGFANARNAG